MNDMEDEAIRELGVVERIENNVTDMHISQGYIELDASNDEIEIAIKQDNIDRAELLRLAKLGQQMQWVSVADRLPEHETDVDIFTKDGFRHTNVLFTNYEDSDPHFYWEQRDRIFALREITHWMPLPAPPAEVK